MDQTLITVLRYSITNYQKDLFICAQYANKHKATALHKAYWLPCYTFIMVGNITCLSPESACVGIEIACPSRRWLLEPDQARPKARKTHWCSLQPLFLIGQDARS